MQVLAPDRDEHVLSGPAQHDTGACMDARQCLVRLLPGFVTREPEFPAPRKASCTDLTRAVLAG